MFLKYPIAALVLALAQQQIWAKTAPPSVCAPLNVTLTPNKKLPDPFTFTDGRRVRTKAQWACRREEISQLFQEFELGTLPPKPQTLHANFSGNTLAINASHAGKSISFEATVTTPSGTGPFPAFIGVGGISIPQPEGVATIIFNNNDMALQNDGSSRGVGKFYTLFGANNSAGAMIAWSWGISRVIDALEITKGHHIDVNRLGVTGCSRNGKGAFIAGAFDQRIALTIPQESGSGGAGCWRISDDMLAAGIVTQTASEIVQENVWFSTNFNPFVDEVSVLPFDHHMLAALVAPRGLLVTDNTGIDWLGPESVWGCQKTGTLIYKALGAPTSMGVSQVGNHSHCAFPASQQGDLDAFVDKFLRGQHTNTSVLMTDGADNLGFVDSDYIDWTVPHLV